MPPFICLMVGQSDKVINCENVEADNTAEAMNKTESMMRSHAGLSAIEIWHEGQLAMKLTWSELPLRHYYRSSDDC